VIGGGGDDQGSGCGVEIGNINHVGETSVLWF